MLYNFRVNGFSWTKIVALVTFCGPICNSRVLHSQFVLGADAKKGGTSSPLHSQHGALPSTSELYFISSGPSVTLASNSSAVS